MIFVCIIIGSLIVGYSSIETTFQQNFELSTVIELPDNIAIGNITSFDVREDRFVFSDHYSNNAYLYNKNDGYFYPIRPDVCHPGFELRPIDVRFNNKMTLLTNSHIQSYLFEIDGTCIGTGNERFIAPFFITGFQDRFIGVTYKPWEDDIIYIIEYDSDLNILNEVSFEEINYPVLSRRLEGGGIVSDENHIYFSTSASSDIYRYDPARKAVKLFMENTSGKFQTPSKDIGETNNVADLFHEFSKLGKHSVTIGLFYVEPNYFLQTFFNPFEDKYFVSIISEDKAISETIKLPQHYTILGSYGEEIYVLTLIEEEQGDFRYVIKIYNLNTI